MPFDPPTRKQRRFAAELGIQISPDMDQWAVSRAIDAALAARESLPEATVKRRAARDRRREQAAPAAPSFLRGLIGCLALIVLTPVALCGGCAVIGMLVGANPEVNAPNAIPSGRPDDPKTDEFDEPRPVPTPRETTLVSEPPPADEPERPDPEAIAKATRDELQRQDAEAARFLRLWYSDNGGHSTYARSVRLEGDVVVMTKTDGTELRVPLERLSEIDQKFAREAPDYPSP